LAAIPVFGSRTLHRLRERFATAEAVWQASQAELRAAGLLAEQCQALRRGPTGSVEQTLASEGITFVWFDDPRFPPLLKEIADPPACLYWRGSFLQHRPCVAVVGSRRATAYGRQAAVEIVQPLAAAGVVIVSGLAFGIDASAHQATIDAGGQTIAVLANGLDDVFPQTHRALGREILRTGGALISEFPPGTPPLRHHFPIRNRIIAGLSLGTVVVEAAEQSGSLLTARSALEYDRLVFAVPGPVTSPVSHGPHGLIRQGATLVTSAADILAELNLTSLTDESAAREIIADSPSEAALLAHLSRTSIQLDELIRLSGLSTAVVTSTLTLMEMKGRVRNLGGQRYIRGH
jgi:DNA processing protein